jgi:para-nitrobenzyl esterase
MTKSEEIDVATTAGVARGRWRGESAAFLGIPYGAAPVGELRFAAPAPVAPWDGVRDATRPGPTPQRRPLAPVTTIPEPSIPGAEILNVSVFTPAPVAPDRRLPVMVWIHGGGFVGGSPASPWYDGASFNRDGVVTVAVSYRLGFDGFGWIEDAPLNRGLLDMLAALGWVRDNIARFGGDPEAVTIAGQSAGGSAVLALLTCPAAENLFRAAVCHSGAGRVQRAADAERVGRELADEAGVPPTRAGWAQVAEERVLDLQSRFGMQRPSGSVDPVAFARGALFPEDDGLAFGPVVDGDLLPQPVEEALAAGAGAAKPLLVGATAHEFTLALAAARTALADVDVVPVLVAAGLPEEAARRFVAAQPELPEPAFQLGQLMTERLFRLPLLRWVLARVRGGAGERTWLYDFRWRSPVLGLAPHCSELPFVWDLLGAEGVARTLGDTPPQGLADAMHRAWVRFLREGQPGWRSADGGTGMCWDEVSAQAELLQCERSLAAALANQMSHSGIARSIPGP